MLVSFVGEFLGKLGQPRQKRAGREGGSDEEERGKRSVSPSEFSLSKLFFLGLPLGPCTAR